MIFLFVVGGALLAAVLISMGQIIAVLNIMDEEPEEEE